MIENFRTVPVGEIVASADPDEVLVAYGVGSCVVVCLYDPLAQVGGMLHALLPPTSTASNNDTDKPSKFVNQAVPLLIDSLAALGAIPNRLTAQLFGGARMITTPEFDDSLNIGERNVLAAQMAIHAAGLEVGVQATGGHAGRTIQLYIINGQVAVRSLGQEEKVLIRHNGNYPGRAFLSN